MKKWLLLCFVYSFVCSTICAQHVVVVGAGPIGLATAIEAAMQGDEVIVVEKRSTYTRRQSLILDDASLLLLQNWHVLLSRCTLIPLEDGKKMGIVMLCQLEEALKARAEKLGVIFVSAEYKKSQKTDPRIVVTNEKGDESIIAYDLLVAADGLKSQVREDLGIATKQLAHAFGRVAVIQPVTTCTNAGEPAFTPIKKGELFVVKIRAGEKSIISMQQRDKKEMNLCDLLQSCKWQEEKMALQYGTGALTMTDWFEIPLQQAERFCCEEKQVIVVGDAAACASYLRGSGANTGFQTAHFAGMLFNDLQNKKDKLQAYKEYNVRVQKATDKLVEESRSLYGV